MSTRERVRSQTLRIIFYKEGGIHELDASKVVSFIEQNGEVEMRKTDHQLQQPLYMSVWQKADKKYPYSPENTGMTLAPVKEFANYVSSTPTSCQMKRP